MHLTKISKSKILPVLIVLVLLVLFLNGCGLIKDNRNHVIEKNQYKNDYNAQFIRPEHGMKKSFQRANIIGGVTYEDGYFDNTQPTSKYFVVDNEKLYQEIYDGESSIDFDKNIIIVYTHYYVNAQTYRIRHCTLEEKTLVIKYERNSINSSEGYCITHSPLQGWRCILLNKVEFERVEISKV